MHVLNKTEPEIAEQLRRMPDAKGCQFLLEACSLASQTVALDSKISDLLQSCLSRGVFTESQCETITAYAVAADEQYFTLKEKGTPEKEWLPWFQRARVATALTKAFEESSREDIADGIYELIVAVGDSSFVLEAIKRRAV